MEFGQQFKLMKVLLIFLCRTVHRKGKSLGTGLFIQIQGYYRYCTAELQPALEGTRGDALTMSSRAIISQYGVSRVIVTLSI